MMNSDLNQNALNIGQFGIISATGKYIVLCINAYSSVVVTTSVMAIAYTHQVIWNRQLYDH